MQTLAATMAVAAPFVLTGEKGMFQLPQASEVRLQEINRVAHEDDWPFSVPSGFLACVWSGGRKTVSFVEKREHDGDDTPALRTGCRRLSLPFLPSCCCCWGSWFGINDVASIICATSR